jgi:quinol monooxygenase YgiN
MAHCFIIDVPDGTTADYDAVMEGMALGGRLPDGALYHGAGTSPDGLRIIDVWEDPEVFDAFGQAQIGPLSAAQGITPQISGMPVETVRRNGQDPVTFMQLVRLPGVDAATFAEMDAQILGEAREAPDGCVFHVNGPTEDGWYVMDAWTDKDVRDRFLAEKVIPVMGGRVEPDIQELPLHNVLQTPAAGAAV